MPRPSAQTSEFVTLAEAAQRYPIAVGTLRQWIADGRLPAYKPGKKVYVKVRDLDKMIEAHRIGPDRRSVA